MIRKLLIIAAFAAIVAWLVWQLVKSLRQPLALPDGKLARSSQLAAHYFSLAILCVAILFIACGILYYAVSLFVAL